MEEVVLLLLMQAWSSEEEGEVAHTAQRQSSSKVGKEVLKRHLEVEEVGVEVFYLSCCLLQELVKCWQWRIRKPLHEKMAEEVEVEEVQKGLK